MKQNKLLQYDCSSQFLLVSDTPTISSLSSAQGSVPSLVPSGLTRGDIVSECGRSMVEILAVVALVGVLSIGALDVFSWAMDKYRANVLTNDILQRGADLEKQMDNHKMPYLDAWEEISSTGHPIYLSDEKSFTEASIQVLAVEKRLCQMTFESAISAGIPTQINQGETYTEIQSDVCEATPNTMVFYFTSSLTRHNRIKEGCFVECEHPFILDEAQCQCVCPDYTPVGADPKTCDCPTGEEDRAATCVPILLEKCEAYCRSRSK